MNFLKTGATDVVAPVDVGDGNQVTGLTRQDEADMAEQGKRQRFNRNFGFLTMLGFTATMMCTWEAVFFASPTALFNGGSPTLIYGFIFCWIGHLTVAASLAEMASFAPTSGGQYHWVAMLAPKKYSNFISWITGWVATVGWNANTAAGVFFSGTLIQALLVLNYPTYDYQRWHGTLLMWAALVVCLIVNTVAARLLPKIEGLVLIIHTLGFFAIMIPLVVLAKKSSPTFVFSTFTDIAGWNSNGLAWFVGLISSNLPFIGYDGPVHLAEEVQHASTVVPRCMIATVLLNGALGLGTCIAFTFSIGDPTAAINAFFSTGYDFIVSFFAATHSHAATSVMTALLIALVTCASFGFLATASRQTWAFARDNGLPFSHFLSHVSSPSKSSAFLSPQPLPLRAIFFSATLTALISLINIGSTAAFNAIVSVTIAGLFTSYLIPICLMIRKRLLPSELGTLRFGPWRMPPTLGLVVNVYAAAFLVIGIVFSFFPPALPVTLAGMNWSCLMFGGMLLLGLGWYAVWGRKTYRGPVVEVPVFVRGREDGGQLEREMKV